jgi:peptide/nickel transport system substrate-binding protein
VRTTKRGKFAAIAVGLAVIAASCGDDEKTDGTTATTEGSGGTETTAAPTSGGTVTYAAEQEYTAYNNATADQVLFANTLVLNMVQPGPFISMPDLTFQLWEDMMVSAEVTSTDPQVVEYVIQPAAVWSDRRSDRLRRLLPRLDRLERRPPDPEPGLHRPRRG